MKYFLLTFVIASQGVAATYRLVVKPHYGPDSSWVLQQQSTSYKLNGKKIPAGFEKEVKLFVTPQFKKSNLDNCEAGTWVYIGNKRKNDMGCLEDGSNGGLIQAAVKIEKKNR